MIDLLIAGGGPAGLCTAIAATLRGLQVRVVEPRSGVIDKACGEGLMPGAMHALGLLGVTGLAGRPFPGIRYLDGARVAEGLFRHAQGLAVRRTVLHAALRERALELGVPIEQGRIGKVEQGADHVLAGGHQARWLVAADGLSSPLRRALDLELPARLPPRSGIRQHFQIPPWTDRVEVYWAPQGEAYVTSVADEVVGVALLWSGPAPSGTAGSPFQRRLAWFPDLQARLARAPAIDAALGAGPFERRVKQRVAGRVLLVGDAAGYLDPLTGEGVRLAAEAALALVDCVVRDRVEDYDRAWRALSRRYWRMTGALLMLARHTASRSRIVPMAARFPALMTSALQVLGD